MNEDRLVPHGRVSWRGSAASMALCTLLVSMLVLGVPGGMPFFFSVLSTTLMIKRGQAIRREQDRTPPVLGPIIIRPVGLLVTKA